MAGRIALWETCRRGHSLISRPGVEAKKPHVGPDQFPEIPDTTARSRPSPVCSSPSSGRWDSLTWRPGRDFRIFLNRWVFAADIKALNVDTKRLLTSATSQGEGKGDIEKAIDVLKKLTRPGSSREFPLLTPPKAYYDLGRLYEKKGMKDSGGHLVPIPLGLNNIHRAVAKVSQRPRQLQGRYRWAK